ncbi:lycopene cyclase domain-containing protein [Corynebacterium heidelbergense]|uniref:Lycopene cyclase domain-containing protein n=1 Tax=Corynebacterium heidelbergense TaxID=2055947 RepID=A0A364V6I5_9CORY|nr:lycopene cyclase domain-containing protein [Corynebacterium heidelbergense]RAV32228.1 hypothetical protein DLJ54_04330 [Corynebacterium heidelbergense]
MPEYVLLAGAVLVASGMIFCVSTGMSAARHGRQEWSRRVRAAAVGAAVLLVITAVFDNIMIGVGFVTYREEALAGLRLGYVPVEDFSYSIAAALLAAAMLPTRRA